VIFGSTQVIDFMERETWVRTGDVQLGKTTVNWKQRLLRFRHLVLAIRIKPVFALRLRAALNGAQTEHTKSRPLP